MGMTIYTILSLLGFALGINLFLYLFAWVWQTDKLTDISYAGTFAIIAGAAYGVSSPTAMGGIALAFVLVWAVRLGGYLFYRIHVMGRDRRFDDIRAHPWRFLGFWVMQGLTCGILSIPFVGIMLAEAAAVTPVWVYVGLPLAATGWLIETIADAQKFNFKRRQPGAFMQQGLWARVRHPNYTGELLFWWGLSLAAMGYMPVWLAAGGAVWITFILIRFSGIPILEAQWKEKYGSDPEFAAYVARSWRLLPGIF
jgi:steroid 5-alpha reductase family enzyme